MESEPLELTFAESLFRRFPGDLPHRFPDGRHYRLSRRAITAVSTAAALRHDSRSLDSMDPRASTNGRAR